ncbi:MAG: DUF2304 domain-containing protein [Bacilli bacterium]
MMNNTLRIILSVFCFIWIVCLLHLIRKNKLPIKYSLIWFFPIIIILLLIIFPKVIVFFSKILGIVSSNNMIIGIILTLLLLITLLLTLIIANLKRKINLLIQEVSILKDKK